MKLADLRGDDDVAGERDVRAGAGGDAVDRAHRRHAAARAAAAPAACSCVSIDAPRSTRRSPGRHRAVGEILSGAEAAARAGQQQHAHRSRRPARASSASRSFAVHRDREAVEPVGPVERQRATPSARSKRTVSYVGIGGLLGRPNPVPRVRMNSLTDRSINSSVISSPLTSVQSNKSRSDRNWSAPLTVRAGHRPSPSDARHRRFP